MKPRLWAYTALLLLLLPYALLHLLWRGRRQPAYLRHWRERFGFYSPRTEAPCIWLHAVSVGETRAAAPLVRALQAHYPQHRILLTHATPTGRETGEQLFGDTVERCYLPYDYPFAVRRFLRHYRPALGLLLETEIWPHLIGACYAEGIPLALVNARLSARSARKYARFGVLTRHALQQLTLVAAQSPDDAQRLRDLGAARAEVMGNLKFDVAPPDSAIAAGLAWRSALGPRRCVILAASTREGEEALLLDGLSDSLSPEDLLIIAPRHPQRFDAVAQLLTQRGISYARRSEWVSCPLPSAEKGGGGDYASSCSTRTQMPGPHTRVWLGDSMGEMFSYYAACDLAIMGGSFQPFGGQNLIEACALGKPVILGPSTFNFAQAAEQALAAGAALQVASVSELASAVQSLRNDPAQRAAMGKAGLAFSQAHQGATARLMHLLAGKVRQL